MLNADGGADSAVVTRIRCAWKKFREMSPMLTHRGASLKMKGKIYASCVRSCMTYGSETWPMKAENGNENDQMDVSCSVIFVNKNENEKYEFLLTKTKTKTKIIFKTKTKIKTKIICKTKTKIKTKINLKTKINEVETKNV